MRMIGDVNHTGVTVSAEAEPEVEGRAYHHDHVRL